IKNIDVRDFEFLNNAVSEAESKFGLVDLMLNNAGIMPLDKYYDQSLQDKYDIIDTNIKGVINGMDAVLPSMIKANRGTIINISSTAGRFTYD
ncbi:SDR family NAD(P)-dependent oxidoreductase, partial [Xanthomonas citri pv. citri]|nr:SDR family NAD(P)-dependent oxidoreductase [Xanthomonas citri pv. citri]